MEHWRIKRVCLWSINYPSGNKVPNLLFLALRSQSRSQCHWLWCHLKLFHWLSMHAKYEVSISYSSKVITKVKVFCHRVIDRETDRKNILCPRIPFQGHKNAWYFKTRHVFVKHGCPRRQQSKNMAKISKSYILTLPNPQGHVMSVKYEEPIDELTVQVWLLNHHTNFKYCTL